MVAANLCAHMDRTQFDPLIVFMLRSGGDMPEILNKLQVNFKSLNMMWKSLPLESLYIAWLLNKMKIDILHVHHIPLFQRVMKAVKLTGIRGVVFTEHAKYSIEKSKGLQDMCRQAAERSDYFTTISNDLKNYFVKELNIDDSKVEVVLNGVDTNRFRPANNNQENKKFDKNQNPDKKNSVLKSFMPDDFKGKILIHVGRFARAKDHDNLLKAFHIIIQKGHDIVLFLVGNGDLKQAIESSILRLRLDNRVRVLGMRSDIDDLMPGADIFVISSKREGLPMVLLESMSCGLPVVSTNVGGIAEIVKNGETGLLVEPENPELLANAIETILEDSNLGQFYGKQARQTIKQNYSLEAVANHCTRFYNEILSEG